MGLNVLRFERADVGGLNGCVTLQAVTIPGMIILPRGEKDGRTRCMEGWGGCIV